MLGVERRAPCSVCHRTGGDRFITEHGSSLAPSVVSRSVVSFPLMPQCARIHCSATCLCALRSQNSNRFIHFLLLYVLEGMTYYVKVCFRMFSGSSCSCSATAFSAFDLALKLMEYFLIASVCRVSSSSVYFA